MPSFAPSRILGQEKAAAAIPRLRPNLPQPAPADPEDPFRVIRSHLQKADLGKSQGSCRAALVTRLHRTAALQEFWCNSYELAPTLPTLGNETCGMMAASSAERSGLSLV